MRVILILLGLFTAGSSLAQEGRTYTCGPDFSPSDVTFDAEGRMVSLNPVYTETFEGNPTPLELYGVHSVRGGLQSPAVVFPVLSESDQVCERVELPPRLTKVMKVVALDTSTVCINALFRGSPDIISETVESVTTKLLCTNTKTQAWSSAASLPNIYASALFVEKGRLWLPVHNLLMTLPVNRLLEQAKQESSLGRPSLTGDEIALGRSLYSAVIHFMDVKSEQNLVLTVFNSRTDNQGDVKSHVIHVFNKKPRTLLSRNSLLSGIIALEKTFFVADFYAGELLEINNQGRILHRFGGLEGPMGMAQAPDGDLCVAEMLGGRIRCFSLQTLRGGSRN